MAGGTTTYKVDIVYDLKGSAAGGLKGIARDAKAARAEMGGLKHVLGLVAGGLLFHEGKKAFIDFNSEVQKLKIGLATVTAMNFHQPFQLASKAADQMFDHFQKMAVESPNTTKDFVEMTNMISSGVLQAGLGLKELETITKGAVIASNALGANPEVLARDVQQMLAGTLSVRDRYARQLLVGVGINDYHKFNKMDAGKRAQITQQAFNTPALQDAAKSYANTFEGVFSTVKDNLQIALGKVGMPLMKALTEEVKSWNDWISKNPEKIEQIANSLGSGLKEAFEIAKDIGTTIFPILKDMMSVVADVFSFLANHRDALEASIKALLIFKGVSLVKDIAGGAMGGIGGMFRGLKDGFTQITEAVTGGGGLLTAFEGLAGGIGAVLGPLGMLSVGLFTLFEFLSSKTEAEKKAEAHKAIVDATADKYRQLFAEREHFVKEKKDLGISDTSEFMGLNKSIKEIDEQLNAGGIDKLLEVGKSVGMIKEDITPGVSRRFTFTGAGGIGDLDVAKYGYKSAGELQQVLLQLLKYEVAKEENRPYGMPASAEIFGTFGKGVNTGTGPQFGFFEQAITDKVEEQKDLYSMTPPKAANVNVNINKIEVYSDDPDRFVAQAVNSFEEVVRNPTMAHDIVRGAF